jgi:hypothetical protein
MVERISKPSIRIIFATVENFIREYHSVGILLVLII